METTDPTDLARKYIRSLETMIDDALGASWESDGEGGWLGPDGTSLSRGEAFKMSRLVPDHEVHNETTPASGNGKLRNQ